MAWPRNTNRSRFPDPEYNSQGKAHAIINYSETSHMVQTERAFGVLRVSDDYYKLHGLPPSLVNVLQGGNIDDVPYCPPVMAHTGSPKKPGEFSPKEDRSLNPLARVKRSPFSRDDDNSSADELDDDYRGYTNYKNGDDWNPRNEGSNLPRVVRPNHVYGADYGKESPRGNPNSTSFSSSNNRVSPRRSRPEGDHIPPPRANLHPSFEPTSGGQPHYNSTSPEKDKQYERPIGHIPRIRTKPESLNPTTGEHPRYNSTSPKTDKQSERPIGYTPLIKTKPEPDIYYTSQSPKEVRKYPSYYETSNNIEPVPERPNPWAERRHQQVIDSKEAAKRYGGRGKPVKGQIYEEHRRTIDCREAAARYNGIFVPSSS